MPSSSPPDAARQSMANHYLISAGFPHRSVVDRAEAANVFRESVHQGRAGDMTRGFSYWLVRTFDGRGCIRVNVSPVADDDLQELCTLLRQPFPAPEDAAA